MEEDQFLRLKAIELMGMEEFLKLVNASPKATEAAVDMFVTFVLTGKIKAAPELGEDADGG